MPRMIRAARVLGRASDPANHRLTAPDEDEFTLTVAALELLGESRAPVVHGVGLFPEVVRWGLELAIGRPLSFEPHPAGVEGWRAALRAVASAPSREAIVVGVDGPMGLAEAGEATHGMGAVALELTASEGIEIFEQDLDIPRPGPLSLSSTGPGLALVESPRREDPRGSRWVGEWEPDRSALATVDADRLRKLEERARAMVSEGAYLPDARYREGIESRWRFAADTCRACHHVTFPVRGGCRGCGRSDTLDRIYLPRSGGIVEAVTTIGRGGQPTEFDPLVEAQGSYEVVLVTLATGVRATMPLTDTTPGTARIGDRIGTVLRRLYPMDGAWRYGRKAYLEVR
jgi:uncharacterized OB-fold protein